MTQIYTKSLNPTQMTDQSSSNKQFPQSNKYDHIFQSQNYKQPISKQKKNILTFHKSNTTYLFQSISTKQTFTNTKQSFKQKDNYNNSRILKYVKSKKNTQAFLIEPPIITQYSKSIDMINKTKINRPFSSNIKNNKQKPQIKISSNIMHPQDQIKKTINRPSSIKWLLPPTNLSAYSYIVYEDPDIIHLSWNSHTPVQIASLTKIMTCLIVLQLSQSKVEILQEKYQIGLMQSTIIGTTAGLNRGDIYSINNLLYGLMLPSGNDASLALAIWAGRILYSRKHSNQIKLMNGQIKKKEAICCFVQKMNQTAFELGLKKTHYANPHGLSNAQNKSSSYDLAKLCVFAMLNQNFRKIVSTQQFRCEIQNRDGTKKIICWENTHKLLKKKQYIGIKTGVTTTAGPCLASCIKTSDNRKIFIVVLKCSKLQRRFRDTDLLKRWVIKKQKLRVDKGVSEKQVQQGVLEDGQQFNQQNFN